MGKVNLRGLDWEGMSAALLAEKEKNPDAKRILGRSWLFDALGKGRMPAKQLLDEIIPDVPVYLDSSDLHNCWVNSAALRELGINDDTPDPKGGSYQKDKNGQLTGLLLESAVFEVIWPFLGKMMAHEERVEKMEQVMEAYLASGVTGAVDMAAGEDDIAALEACYSRRGGRLPLRVAAHWIVSPLGTAEDRSKRVQSAAMHKKRLEDAGCSPWLRVVGIKIISDGVVDSCTAYLKEPYGNGATSGPIWDYADLEPVAVEADSLHLQIAIHAIGDAASEQALDCIESAVAKNGPRESRRHRMEHLEVITTESIARMTRLGICASLQAVHADPAVMPNWFAMLGRDHRCGRAFPWTEYIQHDTHVALGTDAPTAPHDTFPSLYVATTRRSALKPNMTWPPEDEILRQLEKYKMPLETAIRFNTFGSARSIHAEGYCGNLEVGKSADFAILSIDPFKDGVEVMVNAQNGVRQTWVAGQLVWERKDGALPQINGFADVREH